jgi:hypothetical protein
MHLLLQEDKERAKYMLLHMHLLLQVPRGLVSRQAEGFS